MSGAGGRLRMEGTTGARVRALGSRMGRVATLGSLAWATACAPPAEDGAMEADAPPSEVVVRGYLVLADGAGTLRPCGEEGELGVGARADLEDAYARLGRGGSPIFVELTATAPLPAGQAGAIDVRALRRAAPAEEGFGCAEDVSSFAFRAAGVEPFWHVQVKPEGLTWTTPEVPETLFDAAAPTRAGDGWVYEASSSGPEGITLRLELQPGPCSDSMVGAIYTWTASVEIAGQKLPGCAWEGALAPGA